MGNRATRESRSDDEVDEPGGSSTRKRRAAHEGTPSPRKVAKLETAKYVYERLFLQGEGSDIAVHAAGRTWNLHRLYLQQCKYFEVLLKGSWKDSTSNPLVLEFPDEKVTANGLHSVFGSLYCDEIELTQDNLEEIMASASVLQLDSVINRCEESMIEHLSDENIFLFENYAETYGLQNLSRACSQRLDRLFHRSMKKKDILVQLQESTLVRLLSSPELLVVEGEMDLYEVVKLWIFLREEPSSCCLPSEQFDERLAAFYSKSDRDAMFCRYSSLFSGLRVNSLVRTRESINTLMRDAIIPPPLLQELMADEWSQMLSNEEDPTSISNLTMDDFYINATRLGRIVDEVPKCWRWTGFNNGFDLILVINQLGALSIKRNCLSQSTPYAVSLKTERLIHLRLVVVDSNGVVLVDSGKRVETLRLDQSIVIARVPSDNGLPLPFHVHLSYLTSVPTQPSFVYVNRYVASHGNA